MLEKGLYLWIVILVLGIIFLLLPDKPGNLLKRIENTRVKGISIASKTDFFQKKRQREIDKEIGENISFLRNLLLLGTGRRMSRDFVISRLARREGDLKPSFLGMLSRLRVNQNEEAIEFFANSAGTIRSREFAGLLIQWDDLDPIALTEILLSHQKSIGEIRMTEKIGRAHV